MKIARTLALYVCCAAAHAAPSPSALIASYSGAYRELGMAQLQLSYKDNLDTLIGETDVPKQRELFAGFARQLAEVDRSRASECEQLDLKRIGFEVDTNLKKLDVLEKFLALGDKAVVSSDGLSSMPLGRDWYVYMLRRWLTSDITPPQLMEFGKAELQAVLARYRQLQAQMGYAGRDQEFYTYLGGPQFLYPDGQTPQADYEARQAIVYANLDKLFPSTGIAPALVRESMRGPAFPADAYYESRARTFYFNKSKPRYGRRNLDMLMLHESTPGHHFQSHYAEQRKACPDVVPYVFYSAFAEGWSAYVEEFGTQLGLYRQPSDELGAVEWDLVRSIRVVLDVGINYYGWSRAQAFDYWHETLPMLPELAEREITRVRNWPVQAITYKHGAQVIRDLRAAVKARQGSAFDLRAFHDQVLKHGSLPLALLPEVVLPTRR